MSETLSNESLEETQSNIQIDEFSENEGDSYYSSYSLKRKYQDRFNKNQDFIFGFLSGVFFNVFSLTILFFVKSKDFEEGVRVGWIYFGFFVFLFFIQFVVETSFRAS